MSDSIASTDSGQGAAPASSSAALATTPAAPAEPTGQQVTTPPPAPANTAAPSWLAGADETTVGYAQNKGWTEPTQVLDSYRNLEKLLGADKANNAVILPKEGADPKEWSAVYDRLGRPTGPDGYKVEVPPGGDPNFQNNVLAKIHELGLSKTQGETLVNWYNNEVMGQVNAMQAEAAQQFQMEDAQLKSEWGSAYTQNLAQAQQGARALSLDAPTIDKLSSALGHKATMGLLQKIGSGLKEDSLATGQGGFGNALTPAQAKAQIQTMMSDRDFVAKYTSGNAEAKAKMSELHKFAYPEG